MKGLKMPFQTLPSNLQNSKNSTGATYTLPAHQVALAQPVPTLKMKKLHFTKSFNEKIFLTLPWFQIYL